MNQNTSSSKQIALSLGILLLALTSAWAWRSFLSGGSGFYALAFSFLFSALFLVGLALLQKEYIYIVGIISVLLPFVILPNSASLLSGVGAIIFSTGILAAWRNMQNERTMLLVFSSRRILQAGVWLLVTTLLLFSGSLYYSFKNLGGMYEIRIPSDWTHSPNNPTMNLLKSFGLKPDMSVNQYLENLVLQTADDPTMGGSDLKDSLRKAVRAFSPSTGLPVGTIQGDMIDELRDNLSKQLGIRLSGKDSALEVLLLIFTNKINAFIEPYKKYLPVVFFAFVAISAYAISLPFRWVTLWLGVLMVYVLQALGFVKIELKPASKEDFTLT